MNLRIAPKRANSKPLHQVKKQSPQKSELETTEEQPSFYQKASGVVRGVSNAATSVLPGLLTGLSLQKTPHEPQSVYGGTAVEATPLRGKLFQYLGAGAALGAAFGGLPGAVIGVVGSLVPVALVLDFSESWDGKAQKTLEKEINDLVDRNPEPKGIREKTAQKVRAAMLGTTTTVRESFRLGKHVGEARAAGNIRGLARISETLRRDSQPEDAIDDKPRSLLRKAVGLPLGVLTAAGSAVPGAMNGVSTIVFDDFATVLGATTMLSAVSAVAVGLAGAPALAAGLALVGAGSLLSATAHGISKFTQTQDMGSRIRERNSIDRKSSPEFERGKDRASFDDIANEREATILGVTAGLKNAVVEGYESGSRITDLAFSGVEWAGRKVRDAAHGLAGIYDAILDPEG